MLTVYYGVLGLLALFGAHRLALLLLYYRTAVGHVTPPAIPPAELPTVTVQLPLFNERYVANRLIDAVCALDYPPEKLEIQVLDDSTDDTRGIVAARVAEHRDRGVDIRHLTRPDRKGFKAGALAAGLLQAKGDLVAVFDADFVPHSDFLHRTVDAFARPEVGMVQARWGHINRGYSLLTRIQAILLDGHFVIEHAARHQGGHCFNFNGTAGVWRRTAIEEAGGWQHDTLTEDLDLSYRAQLAGWKFVFLPDVVVPAELPVDVDAFKSQQYRWAKGAAQTARKLLPAILRSDLPRRTRLEATIHLTSNASYVLMILLSLLVFPAMYLRRGNDPGILLAIDLPLFCGATLAVLLFYAASQVESRDDWLRSLLRLPALMGLGIGLSVNNSRAVLDGLREQGGVFERTPKFRIEGSDDSWQEKGYVVRRSGSRPAEVLLAIWSIVCFVLAVRLKMWLALPFLLLFLHGYCYMLWLSIGPRRGLLGNRPLSDVHNSS